MATALPVSMAAMVGRSPAPPTMAESTTSASSSLAMVTSPPAPPMISGRGCPRARASESTARSSDTATARSRWRRAPSRASCVERPTVGDVVEQRGSVEEQTIDAIQDAAVPRNHLPCVLGADASLEGGLREIADLSQQAQENAHHEGVAKLETGEEPAAGRHRGEHRGDELGQRALDGLPRADRRRELVAADERSHDVGCRLPDPGDPDEEQDPVQAVRQRAQPEHVAEQPVDVAHPEEGDGDALPARGPGRTSVE